MVSFGNASGAVTGVDLGILSQKGSLYLTRPTLVTYTSTRADLESAAAELFEMVQSGKVKIEVGATYPLAEAARCHRDLEGRRTTGSLLLEP
jgi:NADPH2:quinone reductase